MSSLGPIQGGGNIPVQGEQRLGQPQKMLLRSIRDRFKADSSATQAVKGKLGFVGKIQSWLGLNREVNTAKAINQYQKYVNEVSRVIEDGDMPIDSGKVQERLRAIRQWVNVKNVATVAGKGGIPPELKSEFETLRRSCRRTFRVAKHASEVINTRAKINQLVGGKNVKLDDLNEAVKLLDQAREDYAAIMNNSLSNPKVKDAAGKMYEHAKASVREGLNKYNSRHSEFDSMRAELLKRGADGAAIIGKNPKQAGKLLQYDMLEARFNMVSGQKSLQDALMPTMKLIVRHRETIADLARNNKEFEAFGKLPENDAFFRKAGDAHLPNPVKNVLARMQRHLNLDRYLSKLTESSLRSGEDLLKLTESSVRSGEDSSSKILRAEQKLQSIDRTGWDQTLDAVEKMKIPELEQNQKAVRRERADTEDGYTELPKPNPLQPPPSLEPKKPPLTEKELPPPLNFPDGLPPQQEIDPKNLPPPPSQAA